jgi:hypothetical protein
VLQLPPLHCLCWISPAEAPLMADCVLLPEDVDIFEALISFFTSGLLHFAHLALSVSFWDIKKSSKVAEQLSH